MAQLQLNPDSGRYEAPYDRLKEFASIGEPITSVAAWAVEEMLKEHSAEDVLNPEFWNNTLDEQIACIYFREVKQ